MNNKLVSWLVVINLILTLGMGAMDVFGTNTGGRGGTSNADQIALDSSLLANTFVQVGSFLQLGATSTTGTTAGQAVGITEYPFSGNCLTGTTTLFSISNANMLNATGTIKWFQLYGQNGATTTDIIVGTSSIASMPYLSATSSGSVSTNFIDLFRVATGTQFFTQLGVSNGPGSGAYNAPQGGPYFNTINGTTTGIVLGPTDRLTGFATSSYIASGNGGITASTFPSVTSCIYKGIIMR